VGTFFNNFLPSRFGGDIVRIWDGSRYSHSLVKSSAIVLVERLTGIIVQPPRPWPCPLPPGHGP
jgi:hypothetical protein